MAINFVLKNVYQEYGYEYLLIIMIAMSCVSLINVLSFFGWTDEKVLFDEDVKSTIKEVK